MATILQHSDAPLGYIHGVANWEFTTKEEMLAYTDVAAIDYHKVAYITADKDYYALVHIDVGTTEREWIQVNSVSAGSTNLSYIASPSNGTVVSDTGTDAIIPLGTTDNAGLISPAQTSKLAGITAGATVNQSDAYLLSRPNHTGLQGSDTITNFAALTRQHIGAACSDEVTAITTGTKIKFRVPYQFVLTAVRASLNVAQTAGSLFTVDVKLNGVSIFSTLLTFDNSENTTTTAATPAVLSTSTLTDAAEITIDVTQVGTGSPTGLKVYLIGNPL